MHRGREGGTAKPPLQEQPRGRGSWHSTERGPRRCQAELGGLNRAGGACGRIRPRPWARTRVGAAAGPGHSWAHSCTVWSRTLMNTYEYA